ncbi:MAG: hypothetical protein ACR2KG_07550 [Nocardioidaceae bacterium]
MRSRVSRLPLVSALVAKPRDGVDECLIIVFVWARGRQRGLTVSLSGESWCPYVGHPDLYRPQTLVAQSRAMRGHPLADTGGVSRSPMPQGYM